MTADTDRLLPDPPGIEDHWSVITLARHLCVTPDEVDRRQRGNGSDIAGRRPGHTYRDCFGDDIADSYLRPDAAERIAADLPVGLLARRVVADQPEMACLLSWTQIYALAERLVQAADQGEFTR